MATQAQAAVDGKAVVVTQAQAVLSILPVAKGNEPSPSMRRGGENLCNDVLMGLQQTSSGSRVCMMRTDLLVWSQLEACLVL